MSRSLTNTIANFGGTLSTSILGMIFTVVYFRQLGTENYGLVSFCATVLIIGNIFVDRGIGRAIIRELALREHEPALAQEMRDVLYTLQMVHFALALSCGVIIVAASQFLATHWLQRDTLGTDEAAQAIIILGGIAVLQFPRGICHATLTGLQRQVLLNLCNAGFAILRGVATVAALYWIAPTPKVFLVTQLITSGLETIVLLLIAWQQMPMAGRRAHFSGRYIREVWAFAANDGLAILVAVAMHHSDRIILSSILPLGDFGIYSLAVMVADTIQRGAGPLTAAYYPHFTDLISQGKRDKLSRDYHRVTILIAAIVIPAAFIFWLFSFEILLLISKNEIASSEFSIVLALRALATAANILHWAPHLIQLATGLASCMLILSIISAVIYLPGIALLTPIYGFIVPVFLWLEVNVFMLVPMVVVTHRCAMHGEAWLWIEESVLRPAAISLVIVIASQYFAPSTVSWLTMLPWITATYLAAVATVLVASKRTRPLFMSLFMQFKTYFT